MNLEKNSKRVDEQRIELDRLLKEARKTHDDLEHQYEQYKSYEKKLMDEAKEKANQRVKSATKEADSILKELRTLRDQKVPTLKNMSLLIRRNN